VRARAVTHTTQTDDSYRLAEVLGCLRCFIGWRPPHIRINEAALNQSSPRTSLLHRAINLVLALALVVIGGGGLVYVYFIDTSLPRWVTVAAAIVGAAGLYWLWEEYINVGQKSED
jgi:hypothetical protein